MAFIVKKEIHGNDYYYLNENKREKETGKVKTKTLAYLGKTKKDAEIKMKDFLSGREDKEKDKIMGGEMEEIEIENSLEHKNISIDELANFCKAKGFIFRSSDIYGGFAGFWDYGPLGIELFNNIKKEWWNCFVYGKENVVGMEASIISHPRTWKASGHIENFNDIFVKCKNCKTTGKIDESEIGKAKCDKCGGEYEVQGKFNLMFETEVGASEKTKAYLRGETAQGMFMDFKLIQQTSRQQLPFGIAQIGRCFRNEIAPRDFLFRSREFHIGEFEFFINPEEIKCELLEERHLNLKFRFLDEETQKKGGNKLKEVTIKEILEKGKLEEWHAYWLAEQILWFYSLNLKEIKIREHTREELSHYSSATFDIDYEYPFGSKEVAGIANRGQYDLTQHQKESGESMDVFDEKYKNKIIPKVIEPTFGIERIFLACLVKAYNYDKKRDNVILKLPAKLAPIKAAIFPIVKQPEYEAIAKEIVKDLKKEFNVVYDKSGSIGRRYARNDEIGTPMCITIDEESLKDKSVTIRWRDNAEQVRVKIKDLKETVRKVVFDGESVLNLGKIVDTRKKE
jgi:glycyl-tRNA synthetase